MRYHMKKQEVRKIVVSGMLIALAVSLSSFSIPIGASRCFPVQHMVNVLAAVFLGPFYGVAIAFCTSLIRNLMGTGTLMAFPGSMLGAFCCGVTYRYVGKLLPTYLAEIFGTGILGGLLAYPVAVYFMGKQAALFAYIIPFLVSTCGGTCAAAVLIGALYRTHALRYLQKIS